MKLKLALGLKINLEDEVSQAPKTGNRTATSISVPSPGIYIHIHNVFMYVIYKFIWYIHTFNDTYIYSYTIYIHIPSPDTPEDRTPTRPPWELTIAWQIASPRPVPLLDLRRPASNCWNGLYNRGPSLDFIPSPLSCLCCINDMYNVQFNTHL